MPIKDRYKILLKSGDNIITIFCSANSLIEAEFYASKYMNDNNFKNYNILAINAIPEI